MKAYLCIGGPLHGQTRAIEGRSITVPVRGSCDWIGTEEITRDDLLLRCGIRETRYTVKTIAHRETKEGSSEDGVTRAAVAVDVRTDVLVHESILTFEEAGAYYHRLRGNRDRSQAVTRAFSLLTV